MKITLIPLLFNCLIILNNTCTSWVSSEEVGSSIITSFALMLTALAIATICWIAVE